MRRNHRPISRLGAYAIAALTALFVTLPGQAFAQGFDWSQILGGAGGVGGGQTRPHFGQPSGSGVSVERNAPPFTGKFTGRQQDQGIENTMTAQFACYPASDGDIPQTRAFVCYSAPANENGSAGGPPFRRAGSSALHGPAADGGPSYGSTEGGPPNGAPPDIE